MSAVVLHKDPRTRGQIGCRYFATAGGVEWEVESMGKGLWSVSERIDTMTNDEVAAVVRGDRKLAEGTVVFRLADARAWLSERGPA